MGVGGVLMGFGERLRKCREKENLTQKELGLILGVSGNSIGNYEKGTSYPSADILCKIFSVLRCDANYLFKDNLPTVPVNSVDSFKDGTDENCFFVADLSPEERETIELMRSNNDVMKQIMFAIDMCKKKHAKPDVLSSTEIETIALMRSDSDVSAQITFIKEICKKQHSVSEC